ncbi:unnamed protein product [Acanthoscelides obtectus]|uniref:Myb/SANT-like DNA-binding domain-containing protein n=1 Tax=Acanthoscelides obtectus TaxID=200917 RepID=A0A9P0PV81_ACAOB|nr:unnamed protein product [Acanthoscelides obtectus]CAK1679500.1 hypothetical protein AOBTE_LOCUS32300 [Acanthoscelides obtectus]
MDDTFEGNENNNSTIHSQSELALNETHTESQSNKENLHCWTSSAVKLLLDLRLGKEEEFNKPVCRKMKLWKQIADEMNKIGKYNVCGNDCYGKYRNLLQTYRQNKEKRLKRTGESQITWEFFEIMDRVLGNKASSMPPPQSLSSSINKSMISEDIDSSEDSTQGTNKGIRKKNSYHYKNIFF